MADFVVSSEESGLRLDHVLARLVPDLGLRGRRRLCAEGLVLVNGRPGREAHKVRPGDVLRLTDGTMRPTPGEAVPTPSLIRLGEHLAAVDKPAGLHTEALAGKTGDSLQARLAGLLPRRPERPRLLNRLDFPTSGLVLAALDREGAEQWRNAQEGGRTEKRYLALLEGELSEERLMRQRLALKGRERVLVELVDHPDPRRHTLLRPLSSMSARELVDTLGGDGGPLWPGPGRAPERVTLAACRILKGARHQIRAHAAAAGFPLLGDGRYGAVWRRGKGWEESLRAEDERFYLHHGRIRLPGFTAWSAPRWLEFLDGAARAAGLEWLQASPPADPAEED